VHVVILYSKRVPFRLILGEWWCAGFLGCITTCFNMCGSICVILWSFELCVRWKNPVFDWDVTTCAGINGLDLHHTHEHGAVKATVHCPHSSVEGLANSHQTRTVWLENGTRGLGEAKGAPTGPYTK
jgi:hypothetical protein